MKWSDSGRPLAWVSVGAMAWNDVRAPAWNSGIPMATVRALADGALAHHSDRSVTSTDRTGESPALGIMSGTPLVSAIVPTYNRTRQTIAAIESVLAQTYPHVEVIVVDDGSTDGSGTVIERFVSEKANDSHRILFLSQPNQGASIARNTGIAAAQGDYIAFLDSDDVWAPEKLEWQLNAIEQFKNECSVCVTDARVVNDAGMDCGAFESHGRHYLNTIGMERDASRLLAQSFCGFWTSSFLVRTETIKQIGGFTPDLFFAEDRDLLFRLSLVTSIAYVNKPLIRTDRNPTPPGLAWRPWDRPEVQFRQQQLMLESWLRIDTPLPPDVRSTVKRALGALYSHEANWHLENSRYAEARRAVAKAVRYKTTPGTVVKFALTWLAPALARTIAPRTRPIGTGGHAS
jgi:glycosyltransferase involved in cell wall biosynthesis